MSPLVSRPSVPSSLARHLLLTALAAACAACAVGEAGTSVVEAPQRSAGDLATSATPDRSQAAIAELRAAAAIDRGVLDRLIGGLDGLDGARRAARAATIDRVAAQRYATVSRLYWHTDLAAAQAEARRTGRPILSLRMLGRLDEDLSCANSRFFRTLLYSNRDLSAYLRDRFVLHWSSVRPVPRVTIDFGDGRVLERTVTGNSAHYVLDASGRVIDVLPGLYVPTVFHDELERAAVIERAVAGLDRDQRAARLRAFHLERIEARAHDWQTAGAIPVLAGAQRLLDPGAPERALAAAQRAAMSKARLEVPDLRIIDVGADPGTADRDLPFWASLGQRVFAIRGLPMIDTSEEGRRALIRELAMDMPPSHRAVLDERSWALVQTLLPANPDGSVFVGSDPRLDAIEQAMVADTALNELRLHGQIRGYLAAHPGADMATIDAWIYREVFHTPSEDPWLGLRPPMTFTGLPGDGVTLGSGA